MSIYGIYALVILLLAVSHIGTDPRPVHLNGFFGRLWDGVKGAATGFVTGGPTGAIAGAAMGAIGGGGDEGGGTLGTLGKIGTAAATASGLIQSHRDSGRARDLTNRAVRMQIEEAERAKQEFALNEPMRTAFRGAAMGFVDPTNPFAVSAAEGMSMGTGEQKQPSERGEKPVKSRTTIAGAARPATAGERF